MRLTLVELVELFREELEETGFINNEIDHSELTDEEGVWEHVKFPELPVSEWYFKFAEFEGAYDFAHLPPSPECKGHVPDRKGLKREFRHWLESITKLPMSEEESSFDPASV